MRSGSKSSELFRICCALAQNITAYSRAPGPLFLPLVVRVGAPSIAVHVYATYPADHRHTQAAIRLALVDRHPELTDEIASLS